MVSARRDTVLLERKEELWLEAIEALLDKSPAWKLLRARNAPLILSFLGNFFVEGNSGAVPAGQLVNALEEHLYALGETTCDHERFRSDAATYLEDWSAPESGWLRRFYPPTDDVHYDALPPGGEGLCLGHRAERSLLRGHRVPAAHRGRAVAADRPRLRGGPAGSVG